MYRNFPTPTPRLLDGQPGIVEPTLIQKFIRAVGPITPRQHGDRINGESKVILASPQGILRHGLLPEEFGLPGGVRCLFQLGLHCTALIAFVHIMNTNYIPHKFPLHKRNTSSAILQAYEKAGTFLKNLRPECPRQIVKGYRPPQSCSSGARFYSPAL